MKRFLLTLAVLMASITAVWAQFDDSPELKPASKVVTDGKSEYILSINVEGETYYYGKGNAWGTRTSVKEYVEDALTVRFYEGVKVIDGDSVVCLTFNNYVSDKGGWGAKVDVENGNHQAANNGNQSWVDGQGRRGDGYWQLTNLGNGQIELKNLLVPGSKFGVSLSVADWNNDEQAYVLLVSDEGGSWDNRCYHIGAAAGKIAVLDDEGEATGDTIDAYIWGDQNYTVWQAYDAGVYNAKLKLYDWYWDGGYEYIDDGVTSVADAIKAADEVYNKDGVTVEELEAAYQGIMDAIAAVQVEENRDLLEGATDTDPIELFEYDIMVNGDFGGDKSQSGDLTGWTATLRGRDNHREGNSYSNGSVSISGFAESWTSGSNHSAGYGEFSQQVGLPAGLYILAVDMIATRQDRATGGKDNSQGVELFAKSSNGQEFSIPVATGNNAPEHFELPFVAQDGNFSIGVRENNTTCNWIAMDNFKLYYYGNTDKSLEQINLGKVIAGLEIRYNNHVEAGDLKARTVILDTYDALYEVVLAAYENGGLEDPSEYTVLGDSLTKAYNAVSASIQDYKQFFRNMEAVQDSIAEQEERNAACAAELADYYDVLAEEYEKAEWTREQIDEIPGMVSDILAKYAVVKPGDDVTFYLSNPNFAKDFSGWNVVGTTPGYSKNHGQGENANADLCQEAPLEDDGLAECYHALFDMSQTIENLPAGLYTLSVQGYNRHDDGNNESAQLYATFPDGSEQTQDFANIDDYKTEDRLYLKLNADGNALWMSDAGRDGDSYWVPNGTTGAAWHFRNKKDGVNYDYTNKIKFLMKEAGDLTVGVRVKNTHQWVVWDNFTLVYEGTCLDAWIQSLEEEIDKLENEYEEAGTTSGEKNAINEVINEAQDLIMAITDATEEDYQAMLLKLQAQYNEIAKNTQLTQTIDSYYNAVNAEAVLADLEDKADADLQVRYDAICDIVDGDYDDLNNTELEAAIEEIKAVLALIKMPKGWENASDENPVDFSKMIANRFFNVDGSEDPDYEPIAVRNHKFTEWQGKQFSTAGGQQANCGEIWNSDAFDAYQELSGLPEGTYILACQGFLRHNDGSAGSYAILNGEMEQTVYAYLYGNSSVGNYSTELCNITEVQLTQAEIDSQGIDIDITLGSSTFGDNFIAPNRLATADNFFKAGHYNNSIVVKVGADGILRVGVQKVGAADEDWVVVDNFSLMYLGKNNIVDGEQDTGDTDIATLTDAVYATSLEVKIGTQLVLPIQMKNSIVATGFQADLVLPEGITVAEDGDGFPMVELSTQRTTATKTNMFDYSYQADGSLRIVCNSTKGSAFTGNDGEVALVTLNISEEIEEGDYPIIIKNTVITDAQGIDKKKVDLVKSTLTLVAYYTLGDVNGDNEVDVADISSLSSYILGREVPGFVEKAADLNEDTEIDVADVSALAYLILHPETAQKAKARKVAEKKENIENAYNTLYAEMLQAEAGTDVVLPIMMRNSIEATGFQLDLMLPEGVTLKDATISNARTTSKRTNLFDYARQADGTYRILCNSTKGLSFSGHDGEVMLLTLHIDKDAELGAQTITLKDMVLTDATGMLREESSLSESTLWVGNATGIHEMASEKDAPTYDLQGRQVSKKQKGIHIQNGKKTVVK